MDKNKKNKKPRISKLDAWFRAYTDETNSKTFFNKTGSAKAAQYKAKTENAFACIGYQNYRKLQNRIDKWSDDAGLSDVRLKLKLIKLLDAKETKFFQCQGKVVGKHEVEALEIQRKTLDMALKLKGLYAPKKNECTGKGGDSIEIKHIKELSREELLKIASEGNPGHSGAGTDGNKIIWNVDRRS
ncbi:MAG: hypothetical protein R6W88_07620 [Desulfobacterales bacterium]